MADRKWGIYVERRSDDEPAGARCTGSPVAEGAIEVHGISYIARFASQGRKWLLLHVVEVTTDGQYRLSCERINPARQSSGYAVGEALEVERGATSLGGLGAFFGAVLVAFAAARVRTALRRRHQPRRTA
jgi:hypothetical protein